MAERPHDPDFAAMNGWDAEYETFTDFDLPTYVGSASFMKLPWITDVARAPGAQGRRGDHRRPVRRRGEPSLGRHASARARSARPSTRSGSVNSLQLDVEPFEILDVVDAGDANIVPSWIERAHALIYRKVREVAETGAIPIVLGGDHSITWPSATAVAEIRAPGSIGIVHFDAHADTANDDWGVLAGHGTPMRRLIESGAVKGRNFVQVGLRGYWPPVETFEWMQEHGPALPPDARDRGARRGGGHRPGDRRGARRPRLRVPEPRHRRDRPGHGAGHRDARARRHADPRGPPGHPPDRGGGRPGGHGRRRGVAAVRPCRDDRDGGEPRRARGDQRARRKRAAGQTVRWEPAAG